jgi:hypothetical protein
MNPPGCVCCCGPLPTCSPAIVCAGWACIM